MNLERSALSAMGLGLLCIGQPWFHALFTAGFPVVLVGVIAYNASAWMARNDNGSRGDAP